MEEYKDFALKIAKEAGVIMLANLSFGMERNLKTADFSPVTETDIAVNKLLIKAVQQTFPGHSVLGEEESALTEHEYAWVCDPVDGTVPFSHGIPLSTFSLALVHQGEPILGVILDPFHNRCFFAEKGKGVSLNGEKIHVSHTKKLEGGLVFVEHWKHSLYNTLPFVGALDQENCNVGTYKSIAIGFALVAVGEALAAVFPGKTPWDAAAAKVIIEEAGGRVTDIFGNEQRYDRPINGCLASNGVAHDLLLEYAKKTIVAHSS